MMWVRFPSPAPWQDGRCYQETLVCAHIAQSVEHFLGKEEVTGSNPVVGSIAFVENSFNDEEIGIDKGG